MQLLLIILLLCVGRCITTSSKQSSKRLNVELAHFNQKQKVPDLNYPPPPENVTQEQENLPKKSQVKRIPKGMTPEQFTIKETERKKNYRIQKGKEWNRMKWRKADAKRREKSKKFTVFLEARRTILRESARRSRARKKAKNLGIPETPEIALRVSKKQRLGDP